MSAFDVLNTGTGTLLKNNATKDAQGGPLAGYDIVQAGIACQREGHRNKLLGNEMEMYGQEIVRGQYDVHIEGFFPDVRACRGNGYGWRFDDTDEFGRILDVDPQDELEAIPDSMMLVVEIKGT